MALHVRGRVQRVAHSQAKYHVIVIVQSASRCFPKHHVIVIVIVIVQSSLVLDLVSNELRRMLQLRNLELHLHHVHDLDPRQLGEVLVNYRQLPSMYVHLMITAV